MSRHLSGLHQRNSDRFRLVVILGAVLLVLMAVVIFLVATMLNSPQGTTATAAVVLNQEEVPLRTVKVLVPKQKIEKGTKLEDTMFQLENKAEISVSSRAVRSFEDIKNQFARADILPGEPLISDFLTTIRPTNVITTKIPPGYRAVTINVNATSSVEGWAQAGAKVDIVWASKIRGKPGVTVIVQNAEVLSAERIIDAETESTGLVPSTVTLLVTQDDATKITLASTTGSLSLSLRGDQDTGRGVAGGSITVDDLFGGVTQPKKRHTGAAVKVRKPDGTFEMLEFDQDGKLVTGEE